MMIAAQADLPVASNATWIWNALGLLSVPLLVALNGLFVAAEFALVALRKTRVEEMVRRGQQGAKAVADATANLDRSIAATQLGITLASIALGWVGEAGTEAARKAKGIASDQHGARAFRQAAFGSRR